MISGGHWALLCLVHGTGVGADPVDQLLTVDLVGRAEVFAGERGRIDRMQPGEHGVDIPLLGEREIGVILDDGLQDLVDPFQHLFAHVLAGQHRAALVVDHLALHVEHVVVLEHVLADVEVVLLDPLLRALDALREHPVLDRLVLAGAELVEDRLDAVAGEQAHHLVLGRQIEAALAGVALAARAAAQLVVDPARLVALGAEHVQASEPDHALAELDVDTAAGHVGRDRDGTRLAGVQDDLGLARVVLGVQHGVRHAVALEVLPEHLGHLDGDRADEHRLPGLVTLLDVAHDGPELRLLVGEDEVVAILALDIHVGRDRNHAELVDLVELVGLRDRRAGHAGELVVEAEVVLDRDRRDRDVLGLDRHALLGFDGLVQALRPAPALHDAAGELVDDLDLPLLHDVLDVALVQGLRLERLDQVVHELAVLRRVQVLDPERFFDLVHALLAGGGRLALLVDLVVDVPGQRGGQLRERVVRLGRLLGLARDDQRRTRLVDQDRVDLVDDRVDVAAALRDLILRDREVVTQVVEAELGVRAVGDVALVCRQALFRRHHRPDRGRGDAEHVEDRLHPVAVALGEVVVDGDEVHARARERVEVQGHGRDERLALTGLHLCDVALVQHRGAHHLHVEMPHPERALRGLAHDCECLGQQVVERRAVCEPLAELGRARRELLVGERLDLGLPVEHLARDLVQAAQRLALAGAQDLVQQFGHAGWFRSVARGARAAPCVRAACHHRG